MLKSPSSSCNDLKSPVVALGGAGQQRIKRKPPPQVSISERYPSPDPADPFAPLWVLRNRTSSALGHTLPMPPYACGPYGSQSQETFDAPPTIASDRRHSMSFASPTLFSGQGWNGSVGSRSTSRAGVSPPASPSPKSKSRIVPLNGKIGHYLPYSQLHRTNGGGDSECESNTTGSKLEIFPSLSATRTDADLTSSTTKRFGYVAAPPNARAYTPSLYDPTRSAMSTPSNNCDPYISDDCSSVKSASGMESDASTTSELRFRPNFAYLRQITKSTPSTVAYPSVSVAQQDATQTMGARMRTGFGGRTVRNDSAPPTSKKLQKPKAQPGSTTRLESAHMRFTKFLVPKKRPSLLGNGNVISDSVASLSTNKTTFSPGGTMLPETSNMRHWTTEPRRIHKASISAPQAMLSSVDTVAWDADASLPSAEIVRIVGARAGIVQELRDEQHRCSATITTHDTQKTNGDETAGGRDKIYVAENNDMALSREVTLVGNSINLDDVLCQPTGGPSQLGFPPPISVKPSNSSSINSADDHDHIQEKLQAQAQSANSYQIDGTSDCPSGMWDEEESFQLKGESNSLPHLNAATTTTSSGKAAPASGRSFTLPLSGAINSLIQRSTSSTMQKPMDRPGHFRPGFKIGSTSPTSNTAPTSGVIGPRSGLRRHSRMFSFPPLSLSPIPPSMNSISGTSIVNISLPSSPTFGEHETEEAFTTPRPAPSPPPLQIITNIDDKPKELACTPTGEGGVCAAHPQTLKSPLSICCASTPTNTAAHNNFNAQKQHQQRPNTDEWDLPTETQIRNASTLPLVCEDGSRVSFGSLFVAHRTIVVFIRHFWCPLCQDYMASLRSRVQPEMLARWTDAEDAEDPEGMREKLVSFVVIGNGAHAMIRKYRRIFGLPFNVYTDPTLAVYKAFGMGRDGDNGHRHLQQAKKLQEQQQQQIPRGVWQGGDAGEKRGKRRSGGYVKHGLMGGIAMVVVRAIKVGMPVWEKGGDIGQLGGEFIFGPGLKCSFAHRMQTTKGHAPIDDILEAAGIQLGSDAATEWRSQMEMIDDLPSPMSDVTISPATIIPGTRRRYSSMRTVRETTVAAQRKRASGARSTRDGDANRRYSTSGGPAVMMSVEEEEAWMAERQRDIERLLERKNARRGTPSRANSALAVNLDDVAAGLRRRVLGAVRESSLPGSEQWEGESFGVSAREDEDDYDRATTDGSNARRSVELVLGSEAGMSIGALMAETASNYSTLDGSGHDFIYMDTTETEDDYEGEDEDERSVGPTTSYLFIN